MGFSSFHHCMKNNPDIKGVNLLNTSKVSQWVPPSDNIAQYK